MYKNCNLCPRNCSVNRNESLGFCKSNTNVKIAKAYIHYYEEPCISGKNGSGTIFFSGCNLKCVYCQNKEISHKNFGKEISIERLSEIMIELQDKKANNINLVTPTHFVPSIIKAIKIARLKGLNIPIVYNSSGYENLETLNLLKNYIDIYLFDFKYYNDLLAQKYSKVNNYLEAVTSSIRKIKNSIPKNIFDKNNIMKKGIIVRHLVLPNNINDSKKILTYLYNNYQNEIIYSLMSQYTPINKTEFNELNRKLTAKEYDEIIDFAYDIGIRNAYVQEMDSADENFIPKFDLEGI